MKHIQEYRDSRLSRRIIEQIAAVSDRNIRIMEVCGTHTVSIFRNGIRTVLPENVSLISGPGCPVCVTDQREIDTAIALAEQENVIIATFGDLIRVPGTFSSLQSEQAAGRDIRIVYSTFDAITLAKENPGKNVVFLGIGFETTAPTIAASVLAAEKAGITNYFVYSAHKLMPPALEALMDLGVSRIDGFLLPGHVSVIIGTKAYAEFFEKYRIPCVITGFEPVDILQALFNLTEMINTGLPRLENGYPRAVTEAGNTGAIEIMYSVFEPCDASWRGIGRISGSGLRFRPDYASFDAKAYFDPYVPEAMPPRGCACGDILTGTLTPPECPLYKKKCTPVNPVGPCMVSSEGTCAAYYKYHD
ncbi:MAG: hydrogenase formation protein HypD [Desulfobacterales bacterium]|nr:hydrogenase formation protein HypD [Desulfobacterales bacterium]